MSSPFPYRTRRTIKPPMMDPLRTLSKEVLTDILEDANWAPTHGLTQPWHFHLFLEEGRTLLAKTLHSIYDRITPKEQVRPEKRAKLSESIFQAPVVIVVTAKVEPGGVISQQDELCATACAVQNILLSAHQRGIGSFWATPPVACSPELVEWLQLDATHFSLGLLFLGYPKEDASPKSVRASLEKKVTFYSSPEKYSVLN